MRFRKIATCPRGFTYAEARNQEDLLEEYEEELSAAWVSVASMMVILDKVKTAFHIADPDNKLHPLVNKILFGDCAKTNWDSLGDMCRRTPNGDIDRTWVATLDKEQILRLSLAAMVQRYFNNLKEPDSEVSPEEIQNKLEELRLNSTE